MSCYFFFYSLLKGSGKMSRLRTKPILEKASVFS